MNKHKQFETNSNSGPHDCLEWVFQVVGEMLGISNISNSHKNSWGYIYLNVFLVHTSRNQIAVVNKHICFVLSNWLRFGLQETYKVIEWAEERWKHTESNITLSRPLAPARHLGVCGNNNTQWHIHTHVNMQTQLNMHNSFSMRYVILNQSIVWSQPIKCSSSVFRKRHGWHFWTVIKQKKAWNRNFVCFGLHVQVSEVKVVRVNSEYLK